ncbi:MAG TPA: DNA-binding domain-containing protein, partial [Methylocystis sp.]|nr:DNA-binding domain-containing protein [Methylocystis sp.]
MHAKPFDFVDFAAALLDPALPPPCGLPESRFAIHRNNVVFGLIEALGARFPVCRRLLGAECFDATAALFARQEPPRCAVLHEYGEGFAEFLEAFPAFAEFDYLGDMARFEAAMGRAYHAADATPLAPAFLANLKPEELSRSTLTLHPSLEIIASRRPVLSIWRAHQGDGPPQIGSLEGGEEALILRPDLDVETHLLPLGGRVFMTAILEERTLGEAIARALRSAADFDLAA